MKTDMASVVFVCLLSAGEIRSDAQGGAGARDSDNA